MQSSVKLIIIIQSILLAILLVFIVLLMNKNSGLHSQVEAIDKRLMSLENLHMDNSFISTDEARELDQQHKTIFEHINGVDKKLDVQEIQIKSICDKTSAC